MAGIVKETSELIVTGGGGGGGNVTVVGPLGSKPAASSVSVAIASDQIPLPVSASISPPASVVDANNSSVAALGGGATFTGTGTNLLNYAGVVVLIFADQNSAANGVKLEFSPDNVNWIDASFGTFTAGGAAPNSGQSYSTGIRGKFFRVVYVNGGAAQGTFILQTILLAQPANLESEDLITVPVDGDHAILTKSIIWGKTTAGGGGFVAVKVNPSGALVVDAGISGTTIPVIENDVEIVDVNFTFGVGGPITINTNGPGILSLFLSPGGSPTGSINLTERFEATGTYKTVSESWIVSVGGISNITQNYQRATNGFVSMPLLSNNPNMLVAIIHGTSIQIANNVASGNCHVTGTFKRNPNNIIPTVIGGGANGLAADVNSHNELYVSLINQNDNTAIQWIGMPTTDGIAVPGGRNTILTQVFPYAFNGTTWDRLRGDATNGAFVNIKASTRIGTDTEYVGLGSEKLVQAVDGLGFDNIPPPTIGEGGPFVASVPLLFNTISAGFDRAPGDATNGALVNITKSIPLQVTPASPSSASAPLTASGDKITIDTFNANSVVVTVTGTTGGGFAGQVKFEGTNDLGTHWDNIYAKVLIGLTGTPDGTMITSFDPSNVTVAVTVFIIPCGGFTQVRLNAVTWALGTKTFTLTTSSSDGFAGANSAVTGSNTPSDTFPNPTNAIPAQSFLQGWDSISALWRRVQIDASGSLKTTDFSIPFFGFDNITTNGYGANIIVPNSYCRGLLAIGNNYSNATVKLLTFLAGGSPITYGELPIRNIATGIVSLDTGLISNDSIYSKYYEFDIPAGCSIRVTTTAFDSGVLSYQILFDKLSTEDLIIPQNIPPVQGEVQNPSDLYIPGKTQPLSIDRQGRVRVISAEDSGINFFGEAYSFVNQKNPFGGSAWS